MLASSFYFFSSFFLFLWACFSWSPTKKVTGCNRLLLAVVGGANFLRDKKNHDDYVDVDVIVVADVVIDVVVIVVIVAVTIGPLTEIRI